MFLNPEELAAYTGYRQRRRQIRELERRGVPYELNATGAVLVARATIEQRLGVESATAPQPEPDFAAIP
jgi:hypothetical protein